MPGLRRFLPGYLAALMASAGAALAQPVMLTGTVTQFAPDALGGIRTIIRYAVPRPDRSETDYLLLGAPAEGGASVAIQIEGANGPVSLADVEGADCTLARTEILRTRRGVVLIRAARIDGVKQAMAGSLAQPGPIDIRTFYPRAGGDVGQSSPVFVADAHDVLRKEHVCTPVDMQRALDEAARVAMHEGQRR